MIFDYSKIQNNDTVVILYYQPYELTIMEIYNIYNEFKQTFPDNRIVFLPKDTINFSIEQKDILISRLKQLVKDLEGYHD